MTGGSRGIGRATALLWRKKGIRWRLIISKTSTRRRSDELNNASRWQSIRAPGGYLDENQVVAMFTAIDQHDEPLERWSITPGSCLPSAPLKTLPRANQPSTFHQRDGIFSLLPRAVKRMALKNGGSGGAIVNVFRWPHGWVRQGNMLITRHRKGD